MRADLLAAVQARDPGRRVAAQQLGGEVAERAHDPRRDQLELAEQVLLAVLDLLRQRVAVAGRPALQDVRDEDVRRASRPISPSSVSSSRPAWPTNGTPCLSSLAPGASPTNIRSASALPEPKTTVVRAAASCGQRVQARACGPDGLELLAALICGEHAESNPRSGAPTRSTTVRTSRLSSSADGRHPIGTDLEGSRHHPPQQPVSRAGTGPDPPIAPCAAPSSAPAASAPPWPPRCAPPASTSRARSAAAPTRRRTPCCCACPTARSPPRRPRSRPGAARRPLLRRDRRSTPLAPHEAFSLHPLMTVPRGRRASVFAGAGAAVAGSTPRRAARPPPRSRSALGMRATEVADEDRAAYHAAASIAANFLVDAARAPPSAWPPPPASTASCSSPLVARRRRELGARWAPSTRSPARSPAATRTPSRASARRCEERTPELLAAVRRAGRAPRGRWRRR